VVRGESEWLLHYTWGEAEEQNLAAAEKYMSKEVIRLPVNSHEVYGRF